MKAYFPTLVPSGTMSAKINSPWWQSSQYPPPPRPPLRPLSLPAVRVTWRALRRTCLTNYSAIAASLCRLGTRRYLAPQLPFFFCNSGHYLAVTQTKNWGWKVFGVFLPRCRKVTRLPQNVVQESMVGNKHTQITRGSSSEHEEGGKKKSI